MAELVKAENIASAWVGAVDHLLTNGGADSDLIVQIDSDQDVKPVRERFDAFLAARENDRLAPISRVADTLFPSDFYKNGPGLEAREHLYRTERLAARAERRFVGDSYFDRLIDWPYRLDGSTEESTWNQLEYRIKRLQTAWETGKRTMNVTEMGLSSGLSDEDAFMATGDMRIQHPFRDRTPIGFPCLSHISLTLFRGRLNLTATYRNQHFISKAYGNYVGLARLLRFICTEVGCEMGTIVCIATHADAELGDNGIPAKVIKALVQECRRLL